jgi:hypothetical protein
MSKCDLKVELEGDRRQYAIGDTVTGNVLVDVNAECQCDGLSLSHFWRAHGRGNTNEGKPKSQELFVGRWYPGESHVYPFSFTVPPGPLTYHGHHLNVDWYARATADIPWAIDPKGEEDFIVHQGDYSGVIDQGTGLLDNKHLQPLLSSMPQQGKPVKKIALGCLLLFLIPFVMAGLGALATGLKDLLAGDLSGLGMVLFGTVFLIAPVVVLVGVLKRTVAERKLGPVEMTVGKDTLYPGGSVQVKLNCTPRSDLMLTALKATLIVRERVVSGSGTNTTTHIHGLFEGETLIASQLRMIRGMARHFEASIALAEGGPPSFSAASNHLEYSVRVDFDIPGWPDWSRKESIVVSPPGASRPSTLGSTLP